MAKKLFVSGTGTDVGKTFVSGLILKKLNDNGINCGYYKAAVSGNVRGNDGSLIPGDALYVKTVSGIGQPLEAMCPFVYENAVSPHLASRIEGEPVRLDIVLEKLKAAEEQYDYLTAEGSGGLICPLRFDDEEIWLEDFIRAGNFSCLIVADAGLGTINNVVLTVSYIQSHKIPVKGIIFNHYDPNNVMHNDNIKMCEYATGLKVISCVKRNDKELDIDIEQLKALYE